MASDTYNTTADVSLRWLPGELGLGPEERKSASKPTRNLTLVGINVIE